MIGSSLAHYRILEKIGAGGMGEVYRARDTKLGRDVALKVLLPETATDPARRRRFESEARSIAALNHPNIVTIHSVEECDGTLFLTMEMVGGRTLADEVRADGLPLDRFLAIADPLVAAVACAHAKGIAHRDLKPANVMVDGEGRLKVLDFGLAKLRSGEPEQTVAADARMTGTGLLVGTPAYMSPEQVAGGEVDARSDVFSLGLMFHELLSGSHPFAADYPAAIMVRIVNEEAPALSGCPESIAAIVTRCLRKVPEERFADAGELGRALGAAIAVGRAAAGDTGGTTRAATSAVTPEVRAALDRCDWEAAHRELCALATRRPLSPEEFETLGEVELWLGRRTAGFFDALEKAHAAYVKAGRKRSAARVALGLAAFYVQMNKPAATRGWWKRAETLLRDEPESPELGWLRRHQMVDAMSESDLDRARDLNRQCAEIGARTGDGDLRIVALHDRGQILVAGGEIDEGTALIDEAMASAMAGEATGVTLGNLFCRTLTVCSSLADFDRALEWTEAAARWSADHSAAPYSGICRIHSAATMRHRGRWKEAEEAVRAACEQFERTGPPSHAGEAFNELGELALRRGDFAEAEDSFRRAYEYGHDPVPGLPLLLLAQGKGPAAMQMMERALGENPENRLRRAKLLAARTAIALAEGDLVTAESDVAELTGVSGEFRCPAFRAHATLGRGAVTLERGDPAAATSMLREAWSIFHEAGLTYDAARARLLLARAYRATGSEEDARMQIEAARKSFIELEARPDLEEVAAFLQETGSSDEAGEEG